MVDQNDLSFTFTIKISPNINDNPIPFIIEGTITSHSLIQIPKISFIPSNRITPTKDQYITSFILN